MEAWVDTHQSEREREREREIRRQREGFRVNPEPGSFWTVSASNNLDLFSSSP